MKLAKRYHIDVYQAITWNYSIAIVLAWLFLKPQLHHLDGAPFFLYGLLGLLLPVIFIVIAASIKTTGIVRTDVAERLSLFIPIVAAFLLFSEQVDTIKNYWDNYRFCGYYMRGALPKAGGRAKS